MKKIILATALLSSLFCGSFAYAGEKIKFTLPSIICQKKNPSLPAYTLVTILAAEKNNGDPSVALKAIEEKSNGLCGLQNPSTNSKAEIIKRQKAEFKGVPIEYLYFRFLEIDGKDYSKTDLKLWTVSFADAPCYKKIK